MTDAAVYKNHTIAVADTYELLYTVPAAPTYAVVNLLVCNTNSTDKTFTVCVSPSGAGATVAEDIFSNNDIPHYVTLEATVGLSLPAGTKVYVRANATGVNFCLSGIEST